MKPGVSVARLALTHGDNANQLRNWVKLCRDRQAERALTVVGGRATLAFVPVVKAEPTCPAARHVGSAIIGRNASEGVPAEWSAA